MTSWTHKNGVFKYDQRTNFFNPAHARNIDDFRAKSERSHRLTILFIQAKLVDYLMPYLDATSRKLCLAIKLLFKYCQTHSGSEER